MPKIYLTEEQRRVALNSFGLPIEVHDPSTGSAYILIPRERLGRADLGDREAESRSEPAFSIPAGIRRSQEAYWKDLPALLKRKSRKRRWVAYHGNERIGFAKTSAELYRECVHKLGLPKDEIYIDRVETRSLPPWEAEEMEVSFDPITEAVPTIAVPKTPA